jgi:ribosomal protein S18 acetylase RimI-like enzyme
VHRLLRDSRYRFSSLSPDELPGLLAAGPAVVLDSGSEVWAVALAGWPIDTSCWLRALALIDGLPLNGGLDILLPALYQTLRDAQVRRLYYAGDVTSDSWLQPALQAHGFVRDTDVVVYEKRDLGVPSTGNTSVRVRQAQPLDLAAVLAVDRACFTAEWVKNEALIGPALLNGPYFVVADLDGQVIGYAYATSHFSGRLLHLVRIAVYPAFRGQRVGVRLLAELIAYARSSQVETLTLNTQVDNHTAQQLYEWFGFHRTGERQTVLRRDL